LNAFFVLLQFIQVSVLIILIKMRKKDYFNKNKKKDGLF